MYNRLVKWKTVWIRSIEVCSKCSVNKLTVYYGRFHWKSFWKFYAHENAWKTFAFFRSIFEFSCFERISEQFQTALEKCLQFDWIHDRSCCITRFHSTIPRDNSQQMWQKFMQFRCSFIGFQLSWTNTIAMQQQKSESVDNTLDLKFKTVHFRKSILNAIYRLFVSTTKWFFQLEFDVKSEIASAFVFTSIDF